MKKPVGQVFISLFDEETGKFFPDGGPKKTMSGYVGKLTFFRV